VKIADIEGIGPVWAKKLSDAGVRTTDALLKNGGTKKARQALADKTDLYRIKGVGSEYSDLLERAGVDTVVELATRNAANLAKQIKDLVGKTGSKVVRRIPSDREITSWVIQAKKLPRAVEY
jgi:predicted flap endonuclease-1-like 5' DNA nuclease